MWNRISDLINITSPRRREKRKGQKKHLKIYLLTRKFPNLIKIIDLQIQSAQWTLSRIYI